MTSAGRPIHAVADPGAEVTLVTAAAAQRLGLRVTTNSKPNLLPLWEGARPFLSMGRAHLQLKIDGSDVAWTHAVVVDMKANWDVLVGQKALKRLGVMLMTPAMLRRMDGASQIPDHPDKLLDSAGSIQEAIYSTFPDTAPTHDLAYPSPTDSSADSSTTITTTTAAERGPVVARPMRARIGLPAGFFMPSRDADFLKWDALYPETNIESITARLHHQCPDEVTTQRLLAELVTGKAAMREYVGGCPPPAAFAPIRPPMRENATPIYVVQHTLSSVSKSTIEGVVNDRLKFGIDGPSTAFAQMPVFTIPKPGTTEVRVLFDDSANNSLNMVSVGMQLPTPMERNMFLSDALILSSVDKASFFTQLRLADDVADFFTYDGGSLGKVRTLRMVQGNSESPAIAQAFLLHVLSAVPELRSKLMVYIDNVYLKNTTGDMDEHITDVGLFVRCLAEANVTINMRKSLWCARVNVEVLGRMWTADRTWAPFDHRVETLRNLPIPVTIKEVRRMCGGINSIAEHIEWSQALLAPFYAALSKTRLSREDVNQLRQPWEDLKQALLDVKTLYIPPPGAPLVLRTDAANVGIGAVLLAQRSEDPEDLAPVAYFSRTFGGKQGRKHSTWREACAVYEAVKYFYPYLDGCVNLRIETDCGTVVSLFSHKTTNDADQLAHFKIGLTELGVKKHMISHRKGELQQTADWLSRAKDRLRPDKLAPIAEETIGSSNGDDEIVYSIGYLSSIASNIDADIVDDADANADDDPLPEQQYGALVGALHDLPRPSEYTECQRDNDEIQAWIALCERRDNLVGEPTPEFRVVETKCLRQGVLYELVAGQGTPDAVGTWVPILTREAARLYVKQTHQALAHAGYTRTLEFVARHVWCPGLHSVVQGVCRRCHTCQLTAIQTLNHTPLTMSQLHRPGEHIYIDFCHIGNRGEPFLEALVVVDSASGFMQVYPTINQTAATLIDTLRNGWFRTYPVPRYLTSDNGPSLVSEAFEAFLRNSNVQHIRTAPYHPQANVAESAVKKFETSLQRCWTDAPDTQGWTQYVSRIVAAYAVTRSEAAADTPARLFFGPHAVAADSAFVLRPFEGDEPTEAAMEDLIYDQIQSQRTMARTRANARVNRGVRTLWFEVGDYVTKRPHPRPTNLAALFTRRRGPYRVVARYGPTYQLSYVDGTPFEALVPGNELMLYLFADDTNPADVSPTASDDDDEGDDDDGAEPGPGLMDGASDGLGGGSISARVANNINIAPVAPVAPVGLVPAVHSPPESFVEYIDEGNLMFLRNEPAQDDARVEVLQAADDSTFEPDNDETATVSSNKDSIATGDEVIGDGLDEPVPDVPVVPEPVLDAPVAPEPVPDAQPEDVADVPLPPLHIDVDMDVDADNVEVDEPAPPQQQQHAASDMDVSSSDSGSSSDSDSSGSSYHPLSDASSADSNDDQEPLEDVDMEQRDNADDQEPPADIDMEERDNADENVDDNVDDNVDNVEVPDNLQVNDGNDDNNNNNDDNRDETASSSSSSSEDIPLIRTIEPNIPPQATRAEPPPLSTARWNRPRSPPPIQRRRSLSPPDTWSRNPPRPLSPLHPSQKRQANRRPSGDSKHTTKKSLVYTRRLLKRTQFTGPDVNVASHESHSGSSHTSRSRSPSPQ